MPAIRYMAAPLLVIAYSIPGTDMTSSGSVSNARPLAIHTCTPLLIASNNACLFTSDRWLSELRVVLSKSRATSLISVFIIITLFSYFS